MNFVTIDFETANENRNSPCEIGLTFVEEGAIRETKSWMINPETYFNPFNTEIHGIYEEDVLQCDNFPKVWELIYPQIKDKILIAHFASFDFSVLRHTFSRYKMNWDKLQYLCSYNLAKLAFQNELSYGLESLCYSRNIELVNYHRAGADSKATAELCLQIFTELGVSSIEQLTASKYTHIGLIEGSEYTPPTLKRSYAQKKISDIEGDTSKYDHENIFFDKHIAFTGTLSFMTRKEAAKIVADIGAHPEDRVTQKTNFLIIGHQDKKIVGKDGLSSKMKKAASYIQRGQSLEMMQESEFLSYINK